MERWEQIDRLIKDMVTKFLEFLTSTIVDSTEEISDKNRMRTTNALIELAEKLTDFPDEKAKVLKTAFQIVPKDYWLETPEKLVEIALLADLGGELEDKVTDSLITHLSKVVKEGGSESKYNLQIINLLSLNSKYD